jgi:hypothetical protein
MTYITFDDPVSPGTVSIYAEPDQTYEDIEYLAALLWSLAITHQFECGKVARMA